MTENAKFEGWAIVELMGHKREIGFVTTEYFGGPALFRIDQPGIPAQEYELTRAEWVADMLAGVGTKIQREAVPGKTAYVGQGAISEAVAPATPFWRVWRVVCLPAQSNKY